jgi:hypothetical protein
MAHPAAYFLRYLLATQDDLSPASINSTLVLHGLAYVDEKYLESLRAEIRPPEGLRLWDPTDSKSRAWLRKLRIFSLVHPDKVTREMRDGILSHPRLRDRVDTLVIGNVPSDESAYRLQKLGWSASKAAIDEYTHYFWNPEVMGQSDWAAYLLRDRDKLLGSFRTAGVHKVLQSVLTGGPSLAKYRVGVKQQLDAKKVLEELFEELYFNFQEVRGLPMSEPKVAMLSSLSRAIVRVEMRISSGDQALQDTLKRFEKFKILSDDSKPVSLAQLAPAGTISSKSRLEIATTREK